MTIQLEIKSKRQRHTHRRRKFTNKKRGGNGERFFTNEILDAFETNFTNGTPYSILRYNTLKEFYNKGSSNILRETEHVRDVSDSESETPNQQLREQLKNLCYYGQGQYAVSDSYLTRITNYVFRKESYDMVMIKKENKIESVLITKKNSCKRFSHIPELKLLCSNEYINSQTSASRLAIKLYVFAITYKYYIENDKQIFGLLGLAHSYSHLKGLCLYSKYGFKANSLFYNTDNTTRDDDDENESYNSYGVEISYDEYPYNDCIGFSELPMKFDVASLYRKYLEENPQFGEKNTSEEKVNQIVRFITFLENQPKDKTCSIVYHGSDKDIANRMYKLQQFYARLSEIKLILEYIQTNGLIYFVTYKIRKDYRIVMLNRLSKLIRTSFQSILSKMVYRFNKIFDKQYYKKNIFRILMTEYFSPDQKQMFLNLMIEHVNNIQSQISSLVSNYDDNLCLNLLQQYADLTTSD